MASLTRPQDLGLISPAEARTAYLWPENQAGSKPSPGAKDIFAFQYWPSTLTDTESPNYVEKQVSGGSHPLVNWVGGTGRHVTFTAHFTAEVDITNDSVGGVTVNPTINLELYPSARYTVDVRAAVAQIKSYLRGDYPDGSLNQAAIPPKRLWLWLENSRLAGEKDPILTVLRSAPITYEAWFANGVPRIVEVACDFQEVVQHGTNQDKASQITFLGRSSFEKAGRSYTYKGTAGR